MRDRVTTEATEVKLVIEVTYYLTGVLIKTGTMGTDTQRRESEKTQGNRPPRAASRHQKRQGMGLL